MNFSPFRDGKIDASGPVTGQRKVHRFFEKIIGTVLCRIRATFALSCKRAFNVEMMVEKELTWYVTWYVTWHVTNDSERLNNEKVLELFSP